MFVSLPTNAQEFMQWNWSQIEPYYQDLAHRVINQQNLTDWLKDWTRLYWLLHEMQQRLYVATTVDTTDQQAKQRYERFLDEIYPAAQAADQKLKEKLLSSGMQPPGFEIPLRNLRTQADLFRENNLPLLSEEMKLSTQYDQIIGAQTVEWEGKEVTLLQLQPVYQDPIGNGESVPGVWHPNANSPIARQSMSCGTSSWLCVDNWHATRHYLTIAVTDGANCCALTTPQRTAIVSIGQSSRLWCRLPRTSMKNAANAWG